MPSSSSLGGSFPSGFSGFMGKGGNGIRWYYDTLTLGLTRYPVAVREALAEAADKFAEYAEQYMKDNAPWEDQTGDARAGLTAEATHDLFNDVILLYHTVDYGIWLEVRWSGYYAIIMPTVEKLGPEFMGSLQGVNINV